MERKVGVFAMALFFSLALSIQPCLAWMFEPQGLAGEIGSPINETNWQNVKNTLAQMIEKRISELQSFLNKISSAKSAEELKSAVEQGRLEKEKERILAMIEKKIEILNEGGDLQNATKLSELKEKVDKAGTLDELRELIKEVTSFMPPSDFRAKTPVPPMNIGNKNITFEEEKQRAILMIDKTIERLKEVGDSENVTKLTQLREKIENAETITELMEVMKELLQANIPKPPEVRWQMSKIPQQV
ncbi:MAG: hypothetical protein QXY92_01595 [Archaeoglobaceae archaeon]